MMKKWQDWLENISGEARLRLTAVFLSAMLGTMTSSLILRWGLSYYRHSGFWVELIVAIAATAAYAGVAALIFWVLFPEKRLDFKRLFTRK